MEYRGRKIVYRAFPVVLDGSAKARPGCESQSPNSKTSTISFKVKMFIPRIKQAIHVYDEGSDRWK
jgi:hypothetical protein